MTMKENPLPDSQRQQNTDGGPAMGKKPRMLFLCQTLPYPPDGGVEIRSFNVMRVLARTFDITALCFFRRAARQTDAEVANALENLRALGEVEAFPIPHEHNKLRLGADHLRSLFRRQVYTRYVYESRSVRARLLDLLGTKQFDIAHVDSLDLSCYLPLLTNLPVICTHHNVESDLLRRRADTENLVPLRWYLRLQSKLMEDEEREWLPAVDLNIAVSEEDARQLAAKAPGARISVVPNGVDTKTFHVREQAERGILFVGGYNWFPNRDSMEYFGEKILPLVRRSLPDVSVTWVGRAPERAKLRFERDYRIRLSGYVPDVRPMLAEAACFVVPLRVGGGTRLKILDAWAMGKAVVSTSIGCEGLDARDGHNILIRNKPAAFAEAVREVLENRILRRSLGRAARATAETVYDWDVLGRTLAEEYRSTISGHAAARHRATPETDHGRLP